MEIENKGEISATEVQEILNVISQIQSEYNQIKKPRASFVSTCIDAAAKAFGLHGIEQIGRRSIKSAGKLELPKDVLPDEFLKEVDQLLPPQPWKPGIHSQIAEKMGRKPSEVSAAINLLIESGKRREQRQGVVYDSAGQVIAVDPERTPDKPALSSES